MTEPIQTNELNAIRQPEPSSIHTSTHMHARCNNLTCVMWMILDLVSGSVALNSYRGHSYAPDMASAFAQILARQP